MSAPTIRRENPADIDAIHGINAAAFESSAEARLVDRLRTEARPFLSLVAELDGEVVGHILFTPVRLDDADVLNLMGLAPMAVAVDRQNQGIGSALVEAGLALCRDSGAGAVVVLGHPAYYPRFGFQPAADFGLRSEYDVPDEAFLLRELQAGYLQGHSGTLRYHPAFNAL
jgi:putative acetyltransferase